MKHLFAKLKTFFDAYKMYVFFMALLFGTNGAQMYANHEPEPVAEPVVEKPIGIVKPQKPIIIYKLDKEYCKKLIETEFAKHFDSSRH